MPRWPALLLAAAIFSAEAQPARERSLPLPDVSRGFLLRVAYVENPRFPAFAADRLQRVLILASAHAKTHFQLDVRFAEPRSLPIKPLFAAIPSRHARSAENDRVSPSTDRARLERLVPQFVKELREAGDTAPQKRFAAPYLLEPPADDSDAAFARALLWTQHGLLSAWQRTRAGDGQPLLGSDRYNEYMYWVALGSTDLPYEVVVTNQLIASAERIENSVHSAIRGGVSNGITTQSRAARFELVSILSTFPFTDGSEMTRRLRPGEATPDEADNQMALLLAHELGHQLLHLGHPFDNARCLMAPPVALEFMRWAAGLSAAACPLGSSKPNTPGFTKFSPVEVLFR